MSEGINTVRPSARDAVSPFWSAGWMFTVGFAKLVWWKAALAIVLWPYFLAIATR